MTIIDHFQAVDQVCAWPNLTLLPDGTIVATIFNQPCHGAWEGDVDCYASTDGGETWQFRGRPTQHDPATNRMNVAVGLAGNGDLLAIVSGWSNRNQRGEPSLPEKGKVLRARICRSSDGGKNWQVTGMLPERQPMEYIPFGDIVYAADGALCVSVYYADEPKQYRAELLRSYDDGFTWGDAVSLNPKGNETAILHLGEGRWLASSRDESDRHLDLLTSDDDGRTWKSSGAISQPKQVTGHLLRLRDGRVLLSYGNRIPGEYGVEARVSDDEGQNWQPPFRLADTPQWDSGYPSSIEREDGAIVTAFYQQKPGATPEYSDYEMNVVIWEL